MGCSNSTPGRSAASVIPCLGPAKSGKPKTRTMSLDELQRVKARVKASSRAPVLPGIDDVALIDEVNIHTVSV